jgi:hypothetical protein
MDPTGEIAAEKPGCVSYVVLYISGSSSYGKSEHTHTVPKATASAVPVIATGSLRQGRSVADHGGLYSTALLSYGK